MNSDALKLVEESINSAKLINEDICRVCYDEDNDGDALFKLECGHMFHFNCVLRIIEGRCAHVCVCCATEISEDDKKNVMTKNGDYKKLKRRREQQLLHSLKRKKITPLLDELIKEQEE